MSWRLANSLSTLRNQVNAKYPNRNKASDGTIGDSAHSSTVSQHNPNAAGVVTAMDITHDPAHGLDAQALADQLVKDPRTWYVIFNKRIWEAGKWKPYSGKNDHAKHVHISTKQDAKAYDNNNPWQIGGGVAKPTYDELERIANYHHQVADDRLVVIHRLENENQDFRQRDKDQRALIESLKKQAAGGGEFVETKVYIKKGG